MRSVRGSPEAGGGEEWPPSSLAGRSRIGHRRTPLIAQGQAPRRGGLALVLFSSALFPLEVSMGRNQAEVGGPGLKCAAIRVSRRIADLHAWVGNAGVENRGAPADTERYGTRGPRLVDAPESAWLYGMPRTTLGPRMSVSGERQLFPGCNEKSILGVAGGDVRKWRLVGKPVFPI